MHFWLHQCNLTKGMFFQAWQNPLKCTIHVCSKTLILCSHILCVFHDFMHFLQGVCQMSLGTMFHGFYAIFRWPPKKFKVGSLLCVCMHACTHILSFGCMYVQARACARARTHTHTHTHTHTYAHTKSVRNLSGVQCEI